MKLFKLLNVLPAIAMMAAAVSSCNDYMDDNAWVASADPSLVEILDQRTDLSLFTSLVEQGDLRGTLHALGTYTLFVPTDEAVVEWLGATSADDARARIAMLTADSARFVVKYHLLNRVVHTSDFTDSRLPCTNVGDYYLISSYAAGGEDADNYYVINREARITESDIEAENGLMHVVDHVLQRPSYSVQDVVADIDRYATGDNHTYHIITDLFKTIVADTLGITLDSLLSEMGTHQWYTLLLSPDSVMEADGLTTVDELAAHLWQNNTRGHTMHELLANWVQYHFLPGRYYLTDIRNASTMGTCTSQKKVIIVATDHEDIYLNRFEQYDEPGIALSRQGTFVDFSCSNGTVQTMLGNAGGSSGGGSPFEIVERAATRINWDMADQPEIRALADFRKPGASAVFSSSLVADENGYVPTQLSKMSWSGKNNPVVSYYCAWKPQAGLDQSGSKYEEYVYGDYLNFRIGKTVVQYMEIETPFLAKGQYKVWLRMRRMGDEAKGQGGILTVFKQDGYDDQTFSIVQLARYAPKSENTTDDEKNAATGYYTASARYPSETYVSCCLLGTISVFDDGIHTIRLEPQDNNQSLGQNYDMLMFIPVGQDQVNPRVCCDGSEARVYKVTGFDEKGRPVYDRSKSIVIAGFTEEYRSHIFPFQCDVITGKLRLGECPKKWCPNHDSSKFPDDDEDEE